MKPGPKPKPTPLKLLEGNPGKRPLPKDEPKPKSTTMVCPRYLSKGARKEWRRLKKELSDIGILTSIDHAIFEAYCVAYDEWVKNAGLAQQHPIVKAQSGYMQISPFVTLAEKAFKKWTKAAAELGLTPSSRTRIATDKGKT